MPAAALTMHLNVDTESRLSSGFLPAERRRIPLAPPSALAERTQSHAEGQGSLSSVSISVIADK